VIPLLRASHLQPALAVTAVATALSSSAGRGAGTVWVTLAVLAGQLSVGWSNDYADRHRDALAHRHDKPIAAGQVDASTVALAAGAAAAACAVLSFLSGWRAAVVHLAAVALAWAYNLWLKRTAASIVPYALAFGALPAFVTLGLPGHPLPPAWAVAASALLGTGAHFVNTLPDIETDILTGVRGLPHRIGARPSLLVGAALIAAAMSLVVLAPDGAPGPGAVTLAGVGGLALAGTVGAAASGRTRTAWPLVLLAALATVAAFVSRGTSLTP
jgi:4-hydroxybenzoate polyprenyltransferase